MSGKALPEAFAAPDAQARIALIAESHARLLGRPLVADVRPVEALWLAPQAIVAHGTEDDPCFFFANRAALAAFRARLDQFLGMPSRLSAGPADRAERQRLLDRVREQGCIDDYAGIRVRLDGTQFRIAGASVWNLVDRHGQRHGQAACFPV